MNPHTDALRAALDFLNSKNVREIGERPLGQDLDNGQYQAMIDGLRDLLAALSAPPASAGGGERVDLEGIEKRLNAATTIFALLPTTTKHGVCFGRRKTPGKLVLAEPGEQKEWESIKPWVFQGGGICVAVGESGWEWPEAIEWFEHNDVTTDLRALISEVRRLRAKAGEGEA